MKIAYVVLDGAPGSVSEEVTAFTAFGLEGLDTMAKRGFCGCFYPLGPGKAPESDIAVMALLGYPEELYPGRGPLEALGAGYSLSRNEIALRGNFATVERRTGRIVDRRAGRDLSEAEARELARAIDCLKLMDGKAYARVMHTVGHRLVVVIGVQQGELSDKVSNTDPAYVRLGRYSVATEHYKPVAGRSVPLDDTPEARLASALVNEFSEKASLILEGHELNAKRAKEGKPVANYVLLRDAGKGPVSLPSFSELHGMRGAAIVDMPVEKGIARAIGLDVYEHEPDARPSEESLMRRFTTLLELLEEGSPYDFVYVHLKGPDEPGHDGDCYKKAMIVKLIDERFVLPLLKASEKKGFAVVVLSDHATPCTLRAHSADPVPFCLYKGDMGGDGLPKFSEHECCKGSLGILTHGTVVLTTIKGRLSSRGGA